MDDISLDLNGSEDHEMFDTIDFDCSLPSTDFSLSSPSSSNDDGINHLDFNEMLQGITNFLSSSKEDEMMMTEDGAIKDQTASVNPISPTVSNNNNNNSKKKRLNNNNRMKKGQRYLPEFKRKVLNFAVKHTFKETSSKFNVNCNTLTEWAREYKRLLQLKKSTTPGPGSTLMKTDVSNNLAKTDETDQRPSNPTSSSDVKFIQWLRSKRLQGTQVGREDVQAVALVCLQAGNSKETDWFACWVRRLFEKSPNSPCQVMGIEAPNPPKADSRIFYPKNFKLEVALFAKEYTKKEAANTFCVSSRRLYEWCERQDASSPSAKPTTTASTTDDAKNVVAIKRLVEAKLLSWFNQKCAAGARPKGHELSSEARTLYAENGLPHVKCSQGWLEKLRKRLDLKLSHYDDDVLLLWLLSQLDENQTLSVGQVTCKAQEFAAEKKVSSFKGSKSWTLRFLKRHSHVLQCSSARLNDLPRIAATQARLFRRNVRQRISAACLLNESLGCMDEVPITFVYPSDKVQTPRLLRKAGLETAHAVAILAATSDGRLLPPAIVLKGESPMQIYRAREVSLPVFYHSNGNVDAAILVQWFHHIWIRCVKAPSVMIADSFAPHKDEQFNAALSSGCCHIAIIPTGCAVHLQPCGYNLSQRFQEMIQEEWLEYVARKSRCNAEWGSKTGPDEEAILNWAINAYLNLREDRNSISSSFHLTGLTKPTCSEFELMSNSDVYINKTDTRV